jgi:N-acetylglucosamine kinase-like BadF-type ATPase
MEAASANIAEAVTEALQKAGVSLGDLAGICMCLAGFDTDLDLSVPQRTLHLSYWRGDLRNDVVGAWAGDRRQPHRRHRRPGATALR